MLEKKTILDQIEVTRDGGIQFRIGLIIVDNGVEISTNWHRSRVEPGDDVDAQVAAVNAHLGQMGRDPLASSEVDKIKGHAKTAWTPDVIKARKTKQAAADAAAAHK